MRKLAVPALTFLLLLGSREGSARHPMAEQAESTFFSAFNGAPESVEKRDAAISALTTAFAIDSTDPRTCLHLGLAHLWTAAESGPRDPAAISHLVLAEHYLARAQELNPKDDRIPSWLQPVRLSLAGIERAPQRFPEIFGALMAAYQKRPAFHSFSVALVSSHEPPTSERFQTGLAAIRAAGADCVRTKDAGCDNASRWPHNVEGFLLFSAELEARAGNYPEAGAFLTRMSEEPSYATWGFQKEGESLRAAIETAKSGDRTALDSRASSFQSAKRVSCQVCHRK